MDDDSRMRWPWTHWVALIVSALLWIPLGYGIGALLYFILTLR